MQSNYNLDAPLVASLKSADGFNSLRFVILGYQFPNSHEGRDSNWLRITIEYEAGGLSLKYKTCEFDAKSFARFANSLSRISVVRGGLYESRSLLSPPYGEEIKLDLMFKTASLRTRRTRAEKIKFYQFNREQSGLFVSGKIDAIKFGFKVTTMSLHSLRGQLRKIVETYPTRHDPKGPNLNPVKTLEAKFQGVEVSDGVTKWFTQWIEDDVKRKLEPLVRLIERNARRKSLSKIVISEMVARAEQRSRREVIASYKN